MEETLEEAAVKWIRQPKLITEKESFIAGAKWQSERSYSQEDLKKAYQHGSWSIIDNGHGDTFEDWFEQFKKK